VLYELGRMASKQLLSVALPDPEGLRVLIDAGWAEVDSNGRSVLTPAGENAALTLQKTLRPWL